MDQGRGEQQPQGLAPTTQTGHDRYSGRGLYRLCLEFRNPDGSALIYNPLLAAASFPGPGEQPTDVRELRRWALEAEVAVQRQAARLARMGQTGGEPESTDADADAGADADANPDAADAAGSGGKPEPLPQEYFERTFLLEPGRDATMSGGSGSASGTGNGGVAGPVFTLKPVQPEMVRAVHWARRRQANVQEREWEQSRREEEERERAQLAAVESQRQQQQQQQQQQQLWQEQQWHNELQQWQQFQQQGQWLPDMADMADMADMGWPAAQADGLDPVQWPGLAPPLIQLEHEFVPMPAAATGLDQQFGPDLQTLLAEPSVDPAVICLLFPSIGMEEVVRMRRMIGIE